MPKYNVHLKSSKHGMIPIEAEDEEMARELALEPLLISGAKWDKEQIEVVQALPNN